MWPHQPRPERRVTRKSGMLERLVIPGGLYYKSNAKSMGKRELLLIGVFLVLGMGVYQMTAPAPKPGQEGFSFGGSSRTSAPRSRARTPELQRRRKAAAGRRRRRHPR